MHRHLCATLRPIDAPGKYAPARALIALLAAADEALIDACRFRLQYPRKERRRLERHADAFADQRVCFDRSVADAQYARRARSKKAQAQRSDGAPRSLASCSIERPCDPSARALQVRFDDRTGTITPCALTTLAQRIAAQTAGDRAAAAVRNHHASVTTGQGQYRQKTR